MTPEGASFLSSFKKEYPKTHDADHNQEVCILATPII